METIPIIQSNKGTHKAFTEGTREGDCEVVWLK